jgi:ABC-type Mn2+/Zn2+ transport system permease subunit
MIQSTCGIAWSYVFELPAGPAIILVSAIMYLGAFVGRPLLRRCLSRTARNLPEGP